MSSSYGGNGLFTKSMRIIKNKCGKMEYLIVRSFVLVINYFEIFSQICPLFSPLMDP